MGKATTHSVLERKAASGREEHQARSMSVGKALRLGFSKVAEELFGLPLLVIGIVVDAADTEECARYLRDDALLLLLDGPKGRRGAAILDPAVVGGVIQQQTTGRVMPENRAERRMTRTDAAMCAPMLDELFGRAAALLGAGEDRNLIDGWRFGAMAEEARVLTLALDAGAYRTFRLTLDLGKGARQGEMTLILPVPDDNDEEQQETTPADPSEIRPEMADLVLQLRSELRVVMARQQLPLSRVETLMPGEKLFLTGIHFPEVEICTMRGRMIARGTVGQLNGMRAVQPHNAVAPDDVPMRRASDRENLDLPEVESIAPPRGSGGDGASREQAGLGDAAAAKGVTPPPPQANPEAGALPAVAGKPVPEDLPDLDDLPDLADLPELSDIYGDAAPAGAQASEPPHLKTGT